MSFDKLVRLRETQELENQYNKSFHSILNGVRWVLRHKTERMLIEELAERVMFEAVKDHTWKDSRHLYYAGKAAATDWLRDKTKIITILFSDLSTPDQEGGRKEFDASEESGLWVSKTDYNYGVLLDKLKCSKDWETVLNHEKRKRRAGNLFTRSENTAYESAMRRLKTLAASSTKGGC